MHATLEATMARTVRVAYVSLLLALSVVSVAFAQEESDADLAANFPEPVAAPAGTVSCFDYYAFGSVQANLTSEVTSSVSGAPITFRGSLVNNNPYPLVDGTLYVKIFKTRTTTDGNGPEVVDQFVAVDNVAIPAKGSIPVSFAWRIPAYAASGEYRLATFFTTSDSFNLLGLTFTDDVVGNMVPFSISGEQEARVAFDRGSFTINGDPYYFVAFPPHVSARDPVVISATVRNTARTAEEARISWVVYQWDAQKQANSIRTESATVTIPAGGMAPVSISVTDTSHPVYYVVGTVHWKDVKSIVGVRFSRDGLERFRINFPGVMSFPLHAGEANTLFSCLHNTSDTQILPGGRLELSLTDRAGAPIAEYVYDGEVTSEMMGVASAFTPARAYDYAVLNASLYQNGTLVDSARVIYDCAAIDPSLCLAQSTDYTMVLLAGALLVVLLILFLMWRFVRRAPMRSRPTAITY